MAERELPEGILLLEMGLARLQSLKVGSTSGRWVIGERQSVAGVMPEKFGEGRCHYCSETGETPHWSGRQNINGKVMDAHVHVHNEPWLPYNVYAWRDSGSYIVIVETDEYGMMTDGDRELVVTLQHTLDAQIELLKLALAYGDLPKGGGSRFIAAAENLARAVLSSTR